jgi:hypothetical protein
MLNIETLSLTVRPHRLESRMRENRPSGSEGGATLTRRPYPYLWLKKCHVRRRKVTQASSL